MSTKKSFQSLQRERDDLGKELNTAKTKLMSFQSLHEVQQGAADSIQTMQQALTDCKADLQNLQGKLVKCTTELETEREERKMLQAQNLQLSASLRDAQLELDKSSHMLNEARHKVFSNAMQCSHACAPAFLFFDLACVRTRAKKS